MQEIWYFLTTNRLPITQQHEKKKIKICTENAVTLRTDSISNLEILVLSWQKRAVQVPYLQVPKAVEMVQLYPIPAQAT